MHFGGFQEAFRRRACGWPGIGVLTSRHDMFEHIDQCAELLGAEAYPLPGSHWGHWLDEYPLCCVVVGDDAGQDGRLSQVARLRPDLAVIAVAGDSDIAGFSAATERKPVSVIASTFGPVAFAFAIFSALDKRTGTRVFPGSGDGSITVERNEFRNISFLRGGIGGSRLPVSAECSWDRR